MRDLTRINDRIRAPRVRVIVSASKEQLGVLTIEQALAIARSHGLDLVEVAANVEPPVCHVVDYGKYKYEQSKKGKDQHKNIGKLKEIKFRVRIDPNDYMIKMMHAEDFLDAGNKIRMQLQFRGREMAHPELGMVLMEKVKRDLSTMGHVDMEPKQAGRAISMMLSPLAQHMRKRKFKIEKRPPMPEDKDDDEHDPDEHAQDDQ